MKFKLAETLNNDSVWLHLDTSGRVGISLWRTGKLSRFEHPAFWLASHLWLIRFVPGTAIKLPTKKLLGLVNLAVDDAFQAVQAQDHYLLAQSMCTLYGLHLIHGAPHVNFSVIGTLGRLIAREHFSQNHYLIGITKEKTCKTVLQ